jgi:malonate-semialdehyde dehydrogenase (acetylating)/methylmalonate-semialdehyde dehydrogenase
MAISVLVPVGDATADALLPRIAERVARLRIGDGTDPASEMGPLITAEHRAKVASYVTGAAAEGADVVIDGTAQEFAGDGFFLGVSLVDKVRPGMRVYDEEIFGPVLSVARVASYAEAVALVNANRYANGTAIFTRDGGTARQFEVDIEVGMVGVNVPIPVPVGAFSFGGWRDSLFGDAHIYGPESVHFYTRSKVVTSRWPEPSESQVDLGFPSNH